MNDAISAMLSKYDCRSADGYINALREILQEVALLGLWRGKFFEKAAFYGGTALRVLYGLNRFSEDMDFSLLRPQKNFDISAYSGFVEDELQAFGFNAVMERKRKTAHSNVESAFLKANTKEHLLIVQTNDAIANAIPNNRTLRIKIEIDTDPPPSFSTETKFLLNPIPFSVRAFSPASLFAGKMHAVLCRSWKNRVKGRDWYDLVWYVGRNIKLDIQHLEARMRQSGHYAQAEPLTAPKLQILLREKIASLDVKAAASDVKRFLGEPFHTNVWSRDFFEAVVQKIAIEPHQGH
ncbi:MAG: nucleotidyl transferase AbiEii/AbiGii toxin family protein [Myxococcota bacterium]|jgi:predicted nucleotidyltransferase component of viral defense system|nr:nucleotidyl transferase AbiEii/AbiGii toxin family protein [Myxococcota bacterium]